MPSLLLFNKPFQVLTQFTTDDDKQTLADYIELPDYYAAGRLDYDSEGLLILTNDGPTQHYLANPQFKMEKTYWAQVEGEVTEEALKALSSGVELKDGMTRPAKAKKINDPAIWQRTPPIRERKNIPTSWIELKITEGKNRQVRRMTAAVGFPTLRLIRYAIGEWTLESLEPGQSSLIESDIKIPKRKPKNRSTTARIFSGKRKDRPDTSRQKRSAPKNKGYNR